jgi:hypothetical protein
MQAIPAGRARRSFAVLFAAVIGTILALEVCRRLGVVSPLASAGIGLFLYLHAALAAALLLGASAAGDDGRPLWRRGLEAAALLAAFAAGLELTARATMVGDVVGGYFGAVYADPAVRTDVRIFELSGWLVALLFAWSLTLGRLFGRPWLGALAAVPAALFGFVFLAVPGVAFQSDLLFDGEVMRGAAGLAALWCLLAALRAYEGSGSLRSPAGWLALSIAACVAVSVQAVMQVDSMLFLAHPIVFSRGDYYRAMNARSPGFRDGGGALWSARGGSYRASAAGGLSTLESGFEGSAFRLLAVPGPSPMEALWDDAGRLWTLRSAPAERETDVSVYGNGTAARRAIRDQVSYWGLFPRGGEAGVFRTAGGKHSSCALDRATGEFGRCEEVPDFVNLDERLLETFRAAGLTARIDGRTLRRERPGPGAREWALPGAGLKDPEGISFLVALRLRGRDLFAVPVSSGGAGAVALCEPEGRVRVAWPGGFDPKADIPRFDTLPDGTVHAVLGGTFLIMDADGRWLPPVDLRPALTSLGYPAARAPRLGLLRYAGDMLWVEVDGAFVLVADRRGGRTLRVDRLPPDGTLTYQTREDAIFFQTARGAWRYDWNGRLTRLRRPS